MERFFDRILYAPLGISLVGWQREFLRGIYQVDPATGRRRYRRGYSTVAKKNGKSFLIAGLPLFHLVCEVENEPRALRAYGAAASRDQASEVFEAAEELLAECTPLKSILRCVPSTKHIHRRDGRGLYKVISADGGKHDGKGPSLVIIDELHRWTTKLPETLYQVLTKGVIARTEPFIVEITTAGEEYECPLWEREQALAEQIRDGLESQSLFVQIYSADRRRYEREPEYWKSRQARVDANPSHEDNGGFLKDAAIIVELEKAVADASEKPNYVRYHLNLMVNRGEEAAIDMDRWRENQDVDLRTWPLYDEELLIRKWGLIGRSCYVGIDLAASIDLAALSFVFPPDEEDGIWTLLPFAWVPQHRTAKNQNEHYPEWVERGWLTECKGWEIRNSDVKSRLDWGRDQFDIREVCFDPWNAKDLRQTVEDDGYVAVEIPQVFLHLSEPTKRLLAIYVNGKLRHGNNPVLDWNASCATTQGDKKDNKMFCKPDRSRTGKRIDMLAAATTGMARAITAEPEKSPGFLMAS